MHACIHTYIHTYRQTDRQTDRQPEYQKRKVEEHLGTCGKGTFKIFPLLQMRNSKIDLRRSYEKNFVKKYEKK